MYYLGNNDKKWMYAVHIQFFFLTFNIFDLCLVGSADVEPADMEALHVCTLYVVG